MLIVRQFRAEDAEAVRDLFAHAQDDVAESYSHTAADREGFHEYIDGALNHDLAHVEQSYLQRPRSNFWIAELDGQTVGCIGAYRRDDEEAEIRRLAVDRSARRQGVASRLLDQAEEFCRDAGYARAIVWTANHMTAAIAFLQHRGYHELEDHAFPHTSLTLFLYGLEL
ncbi:MAG: GNAT family N-acetyltransferase [Chloroflexota bacterium]|nr:GNAT family N-acetyltransferase [Chloroflexota bacterium]MDE2959963.1 GNAT family N-acetyltransferase [Chloroflexota bacterium]